MNEFTIMLGVYLLFMVFLGAMASRTLKNVDDFLVAGRNLNLPLTAGSLMATWTGAAAVTGYTAWIYEAGYSMMWIAVFTTTSLLLIALVLSRRLQKLGYLTVCDILRDHYDKRTKTVGAVLISVYCIGVVSGEFLGGAYILSAGLGYDFSVALLLTAGIVLSYCLLGGLWAVALTDLVQFCLLAAGLAIAVPSVLRMAGGWTVLHHTVAEIDPGHLDIFAYASSDVIIAWAVIIFASNLIAPDIYQRMYAARSGRIARMATGITGLWDVFLTVAAIILGLSAFLRFQGEPLGDMVLPRLIMDVFPRGFTWFFMVVLVAVIMSTADSLLVVAGGTLYHDVLGKEESSSVASIRVLTLGSGVVSLGLCFYFESIMDSILFSSSVYAAGLFIPVISALVWKKGTKDAAFYGCVCGGGVTIAWRILNLWPDPVIPGIAVCLLVFVILSYLRPYPVYSM
ncbi:MAG: sodium:solute symporter family protein [Theionarchaea archaeon]|nr:sodium:solute symporter family protein [Theionarchaea archaeon]MBU7038856.1 sodium:solute symporter family protein [Theionarchaea archaeon]